MIRFLKERRDSPEFSAFAAALVVGFLTHLFTLVNVTYNFDNIAMAYFGTGAGVHSGRWLLQTLGEILEGLGLAHNLTLVGGMALIFFLALSAAVTVSVFQLRSRTSSALLGCLFVVFPSIVSTMFYRYTTLHYGIAILLAVLAVWVLPRHRLGLVLSGLCIAGSMGIYQAYVPLTIAMFVLLLIQEGLAGQADFWKIVKRGLWYCAALALGVVLYFVILKVYLWAYDAWLNAYQGISSMGKISLTDLPGLVLLALKNGWTFPLTNYCTMIPAGTVKLAYLLLAVLAGGMTAWILVRKVRNPGAAVAVLGLLLVVFPIAVDFITIMCAGTANIYVLMSYAFVIVPCVPLVLLEQLPQENRKLPELLRKTVTAVLTVLIFFYSYYANVNYAASYHATLQTGSYLNSIVVQARMTEGFDGDKKWAFLGKIQDPQQVFDWENSIVYGGHSGPDKMVNAYSRQNWLRSYLGYDLPLLEEEAASQLAQTEEVRAMPCWPAEGSIRIIGDTVVLKFQELAQ